MRYNLGLMDMYPIEASGTNIENDPLFRIIFKDKVDPVKLEDAVYKAIRLHPLFGTKVCFDRNYYLVTNNRPIKIINSSEKNRPRKFGKATNDYPWQMCWDENIVTFEWCHGITDGMGAMEFIETILSFYCGAKTPEVPRRIQLGPGLEPFVDKSEKGENFSIDPKGFSIKDFPAFKRGYKTDCHVLKADISEVLSCSKENETTVAPILSILLSKAIKNNLPERAKNRNVACNIVLDLRRPLAYETMHNCVEYKRVTYQDKHDNMSFKEVAKEYKSILDNARIPANVVRAITERVSMFKAYHILKPKCLRKLALRIIGFFMKDTDCNCVMTYLGKTNTPKEVLEMVEDIQVCCWHDFGECIMACVDYNGILTANICENFINKGIIADFIKLSSMVGINWNYMGCSTFEQAQFVE